MRSSESRSGSCDKSVFIRLVDRVECSPRLRFLGKVHRADLLFDNVIRAVSETTPEISCPFVSSTYRSWLTRACLGGCI